ncbi:hypothetical protein DL93DRAFT_1573760 [Clavulina sp. PMI_390]|nr:hypothetical protein DL93DRAFT_1573760 [Clavulina sp. PMI_390]
MYLTIGNKYRLQLEPFPSESGVELITSTPNAKIKSIYKTAKEESLVWDNPFGSLYISLPVRQSNVILSIGLVEPRFWQPGHIFAHGTFTVEIGHQEIQGLATDIVLPTGTSGRLSLVIPALPSATVDLQSTVAAGASDLPNAGLLSGTIGNVQDVLSLSGIQAVTSTTIAGKDLWISLLDQLQVINSIAEKVASIHPFASLAWGVVFATYKPVILLKQCKPS